MKKEFVATDLGEALQFDWSDQGVVIGGNYYKLQVSHLKLYASRAFWLVTYPSQGQEMLFEAHTRLLNVLGGILLQGIYENMKRPLETVKEGKDCTVNAQFLSCARTTF